MTRKRVRRKQKTSAVIAALLIVVCCGALLYGAMHFFSGERYVSETSSSGVEEKSMATVSAEITTHSQVEISDESGSTVYGQISKVSLPKAEGYNAISMEQGKESLDNSALKELYEEMEKSVYHVSEEQNENLLYPVERITVRGADLTGVEVVRVLSAFLHDHPDVFWISSQYGYASGMGRTVVQLYSMAPPSDCQKFSKQMISEIEQILQGIPENADALDREIYLYDTIIERCLYDDEAAASNDDWRAHTILGVLLDGEAVCEGYARTLQLLLNQSGIPSMLVTGTASGAHMWNLVRIDGQWYHADATWDDNGDMAIHKYLNLSDEMIQADHTLYPIAGATANQSADQIYNLPLPSCTAVKANYFRAKGVQVTSENCENTIKNAIVKAAKNKEPSVSVFIGESLDYDGVLQKLFQQSPYLLMNAVDGANAELEENQVDYNQCSYIEARESRGVVILLKYE